MTALEYLTEIGLTLVWYFYLKLVCINMSFFSDEYSSFWYIFLQLSLWWLCGEWYQDGTGAEGQRAPTELGKVSAVFTSRLLWVGLQYCIIEMVFLFSVHICTPVLVIIWVILCVSKNAFSSPRSRMEEVWLIMYLLFLTCCPFRGCVCRNLEIQYFFFSLANNPYIIL